MLPLVQLILRYDRNPTRLLCRESPVLSPSLTMSFGEKICEFHDRGEELLYAGMRLESNSVFGPMLKHKAPRLDDAYHDTQ